MGEGMAPERHGWVELNRARICWEAEGHGGPKSMAELTSAVEEIRAGL